MLNKAHVYFYTPDRNVTCEWLSILKTTQGHGQTSYFSKTVMFIKQTDQGLNFTDATFTMILFLRLSILEEKKYLIPMFMLKGLTFNLLDFL